MIVLATLTAGTVMAQSVPVLHTADQQTANGSGTSITVSPPSNLSKGDLVIVTTQARDGGTIGQVGSNFTLIRQQSSAADNDRSITAVWYRIATDSEPASYEFERTTGNAREWRATANRVTSHAIDSPIGNNSGKDSGGSTNATSLVIPGIETSVNNVLLLSVLTVARGNNATNITHPVEMTAAWTLRGDDNFPASAGSTEERETAGDTGNRKYTWDAGDGASGVMFEILPLAADGSGTNTVSPTSVEAGSDGNTLTFTYTAETGGMRNGEVEITVPSGWSAPSTTGSDPGFTTSTTGTVGVTGQVITVTGVTLGGGETMDIVYGDKGSVGPGATAQETAETVTFTTRQRSTSDGTLTEISSSPEVTVEPADAAQLIFDQQPTHATAGEVIDPAVTVRVEDEFGNLVDSDNSTEVSVSLGTDPSGGSATLSGTTTVTASSGVATFDDLSIDEANDGYTLQAAASGLTGEESTAFDITSGDPNHITLEGPSTVTAGETSGDFILTVRDSEGNATAVSGDTDFILTKTSDGTVVFDPPSPVTVSGGSSSTTFTYSDTEAGDQKVVATWDSGPDGDLGSDSYTITVEPAAASQLAFAQQPTTSSAGVAIDPAVTVRVEDEFGNLVDSDNSTEVSMSLGTDPSGGSATLSGTTTVTAANGVATFDDLSIDEAHEGYTLRAASSGLTGEESTAFDITSSDPDHITLEGPSTVTAGETSSEFTLTVRDSEGNATTVSEDTDFVLSTTSDGTVKFDPSSVVTVSAGSSSTTFTYSDTEAGDQTVTATPPNNPPDAGLDGESGSHTITVEPADAVQLAFAQQPTTSSAGATIDPAVTVRVEDEFGNLVDSDNSTEISMSLGTDPSGGSASLSGTTTVTAANGVATFDDLSIDEAHEGYTLEAAASGLTGDESDAFEITPASPDHITLEGPSSVTAGETSGDFTLTVRDGLGNVIAVSEDTDFVLSTTSGGTVTFDPPSPVTVSAGSSSTTFTYSDTEAGDQTVTASWESGPDGDLGSDTHTITVEPASGDASQTTASVPNGTAGEATDITISVEDAFGNAVTGAAGDLSASVTGGPNSGASFTSITDNGDGTYSTSYTPIETGTDEITITLDGTGISGSPYSSTVGTAGAEAVDVITQPSATTAGQSIEGPPTVRVTDTEGNPVEGVSVSVSEEGGQSFDSGTTSRSTDSDGEAAFDDLVINTAGSYRLVFDAGVVDEDAVSSEFDVVAAAGDPSETTAEVPDGRVGEETLITITVRDEFENPVSGAADALSLSISGANEDTELSGITDNGDGTYSVTYMPTRLGTDQIRITLDGDEISGNPFTSEVDHGAVETLEIVSGDGQEQPTRSWLEEPLVVRALDRFDNPVPGETVTFEFTQTPPGAVDHEVEQTEVTTSDEGRAQTSARLGSEGGTYRIRASTNGASVEFTFTAERTVPDPSFSDTVRTVVFTPDPNSFMFTEYDESLDQPQGFNWEIWLKPTSLNSNGPIAGRWDEELGRQFRISLFGNTLLIELMDDEGELYELEIEEFFRFTETGTGNQSGVEEKGSRLQDEHLESEWAQISLVVDPSNELVQVYKNGFEIRRSQILSDLQSSADRLEVGRGLDGEIHEIRLWDRPRSRTEIQALKDLILTGSEENLVLYHTFDEESGERTAVDRSPNRNNFILSDLVSRSTSLRDVTRITLHQNEEFIVRLAALDKTGGDLEAEVTKLPDNGRLFQLKPDLTRGEEITQPGTVLTDPFNRSLYVPDDNFIGIDTIRYRIFDQLGNFAEPILEFEVLKVNRPPTIDPIEPIHFYQTDTLYVDLDTLVTDNTYDPEDMVWDVEILDPRYAGKEDQLEQRPVVELDQEERRLMLTSTLLFIADDIRMRLRVTDPKGLFGLRIFHLSVRPLDEKPGGVYELMQNYPNPYNSSTQIEFWVPVQAEVVLEVYDLLGRKVATLVDRQNLPAGIHQVDWTLDNLASGIYFYRLEALGEDNSRFVKTRKLTFIK